MFVASSLIFFDNFSISSVVATLPSLRPSETAFFNCVFVNDLLPFASISLMMCSAIAVTCFGVSVNPCSCICFNTDNIVSPPTTPIWLDIISCPALRSSI